MRVEKQKACLTCGKVSGMHGKQSRCGSSITPGSCAFAWYQQRKREVKRISRQPKTKVVKKKVKKAYKRDPNISDWLMY